MRRFRFIYLSAVIFSIPEYLFAGSGNASDGMIFIGALIGVLTITAIILQLFDFIKNNKTRIKERVLCLVQKSRLLLHNLFKLLHKKNTQDHWDKAQVQI